MFSRSPERQKLVSILPLYHCCSSFLSKCVDFCRSSNCWGVNLDCLRKSISCVDAFQ